MRLGELTMSEAAKQAAGNWTRFRCFVWWRETDIKDSDKWGIFYTHHRDSGLLDQSNASVIAKALGPFAEGQNPDVVFESHSHWAVGYVVGISIRVYKRRRITKAFKTYHELERRIDDYPVLDESDYDRREYEATIENIADSAWRLKNEYELPDDWVDEVHSWLSEHRCTALENCDDQGGYPTEDDLEAAFDALGYARKATA